MIKMMPLKQVCSGIIDCPHESPEWLSKGIPVIRNFNLVDGQIDMSDASYVDESTYTKRTRRAVPSAGDIIFSREAPIGNCAIVPADFKCCLGQRLVLLRVNREICSPEYLLAALLSDFVKTQIFQVEKSGSIVSNFNISDLGDLIIPIIDRQESVASVSDTLNKKLLINKNICAELEAMAKTLYDYWFTQFDFPNAEGKPYRSSGGEMVWNDQLKREIPMGWVVTTMSALTTVLTGKEDANFSTPNGNYKFFTCAQEAIFCDTPAFSGHAVLIAGNGDFNVKHYTGDFNAYQRTYVLIPKEAKYYAVMYIAAQKRIQAFKQGSNGSIVKFITKGDVESIPIILPDNDVYLDTLNRILEKIEHCERENNELTKLRDWLLPMLMNGQATVE